jgi:hypothetical protein
MKAVTILLATASVILATGVHGAAAAERIHITFNGYRPGTNDYCITADSVQGDPMFGFLWRFSAGGGPSQVTGAPLGVNLLSSTSVDLFPTSFAEREKFRVYSNLLGPLVGSKSVSNELNARRSDLCFAPGPGLACWERPLRVAM